MDALDTLKDQPFFLGVGFRRPHLPFACPEKYWNLYDRNQLAKPVNPNPPENVPELALHDWWELRNYLDIPDKGPLSAEKIAELRHGYYAATSFVDAQIGKVIQKLDDFNLRDNTVVVLWSDHGYHLGEHNLWCKTTNFEWDTHVPLIISTPDQKTVGVKTEALVEIIDLYPSLAELCGLPVPADLDGKSMAPLLSDPSQPWKKAALSQFPRPWGYRWKTGEMGYSVRTQRFRYTEWIDWKTGKMVAQELYDHRIDSLETRNVAYKDAYRKWIPELSKTLHELCPILKEKRYGKATDNGS
jgi:iduronate 2-sulfatase